MIKHRKRPVMTDIEVGSFSDVAFLLIIFFILTTQITRFTGTTVEIPAGKQDQKEQQEQKEQLTINLVAGQIRLTVGSSVTPMTPDALKTKLEAANFHAKTKPEEKQVILVPTGDVAFELYFEVLAMIDEAGGIVVLMDEDEGSSQKGGS